LKIIINTSAVREQKANDVANEQESEEEINNDKKRKKIQEPSLDKIAKKSGNTGKIIGRILWIPLPLWSRKYIIPNLEIFF
jgi:septal ring factor EnvC (AmiA/AmiB activator)